MDYTNVKVVGVVKSGSFLHRTRMPKFIFLIVVAMAMMMKEAIGRWEVIVSTF